MLQGRVSHSSGHMWAALQAKEERQAEEKAKKKAMAKKMEEAEARRRQEEEARRLRWLQQVCRQRWALPRSGICGLGPLQPVLLGLVASGPVGGSAGSLGWGGDCALPQLPSRCIQSQTTSCLCSAIY